MRKIALCAILLVVLIVLTSCSGKEFDYSDFETVASTDGFVTEKLELDGIDMYYLASNTEGVSIEYIEASEQNATIIFDNIAEAADVQGTKSKTTSSSGKTASITYSLEDDSEYCAMKRIAGRIIIVYGPADQKDVVKTLYTQVIKG